ncbi:MAG TPA: hypothetical protein VN854_00075 [Mycoplasmatales bacterium]|nr:hypothetical protein [Mycoplasmatales bacterium]
MENNNLLKKEISNALSNVSSNPDEFLSEITKEKERIQSLEKELNSNKWFWERRETMDSSLLTKFNSTNIPSSLKNRISLIESKYKYNKDPSLLLRYLSLKDEYQDWIKSNLIVNERKDLALRGILNNLEGFSTEFKSKTLEIDSLEKTLVELKVSKTNLENTLLERENTIENTLTAIKGKNRILDLNSANTNDLALRIQLAEAEAFQAHKDLIIMDELNKSLRVRIKALESQIETNDSEIKHLRIKYENDSTTALKKLKERDLALEDAAQQLTNTENVRDNYYKLYRETIEKLAKTRTELQHYKTISSRLTRWSHGYLSTFKDIFLSFTIILFIIFIFFIWKKLFKRDRKEN